MYDVVMTDTTSYIESAHTLTVPGWEIPAALTLPVRRPHDAELASAILLVPGSLFSDVNGDYPTWSSFPHVYAHLAHQLAARGHAVYRFAKLGPGTGSVAVDAGAAAKIRTWEGRLAIATAALDAMRRELETQNVRVARTIVAGHSEGAVVASRLAVSERAGELDGIVLLAGPSLGILGIMREQIGVMTPPQDRDDAIRRLDVAIDCIRRGQPIPAELATGSAMGVGALASMPDEGRRYMRDVDATDPKELASRMTQPTLVVQGGNDGSVPAHHGEALRDILLSRNGGEARTNYLFVPDVTHMFKVVPAGLSGPDAFGYPGDTDPRVTDGVDRWIRMI
jgi:alpha-beta hydrolase superfamily lysophospholipase